MNWAHTGHEREAPISWLRKAYCIWINIVMVGVVLQGVKVSTNVFHLLTHRNTDSEDY